MNKIITFILFIIILGNTPKTAPMLFKSLSFNIHDVHQKPGISYDIQQDNQQQTCQIKVINNQTKKFIVKKSPFTCLFLQSQISNDKNMASEWENYQLQVKPIAYVEFFATVGEKKVIIEIPTLSKLNKKEIKYSAILNWINFLNKSFYLPNKKEFLEKTR